MGKLGYGGCVFVLIYPCPERASPDPLHCTDPDDWGRFALSDEFLPGATADPHFCDHILHLQQLILCIFHLSSRKITIDRWYIMLLVAMKRLFTERFINTAVWPSLKGLA